MRLGTAAVGILAVASTACSAAAGGSSVRVDRPTEIDDEHVYIDFDEPIQIEQGAAWDELKLTLAAEFGEVLPDSDAFNPTWWFDTTKSIDAETATPSDDCTAEAAAKPAGLRARFEMARTIDPELYREGLLELTVLRDDATVVAEYATSRAEAVACLASGLSDGISLVRLEHGLPDHTTVAYNIDYEPTGPDEDGIERSIGFTVVQLHHGSTFVQLMMHAIQPVTHPEWIDIEHDALRIASAIDLGE